MALLPADVKIGQRVLDLAYERGLIVYFRRVKGGVQGDYIMVAPPLIVTREQIGEIVAILGDAIAHRGARVRPAGQRRGVIMARKTVIITCAVTGSIHTPTMSPYLPVTPDEIAAEAIAAAEAGASILHLHARDPENGRPTADPDVFMQFLPRIKQATDAVINITTGGSSLMTLDQRLAAPLRAEPEMCSLNMGSMNFGAVSDARQAARMEARLGAEAARSDARHDLQEHLRRHRDDARQARAAAAARGSSSSATMSATSIRWRIFATGVWCRGRCSSSSCSASWAASAPIRKT